ncbi:protein translocase subunit SecF [Nocardioides flavescens]|uniref:Protein-export membrane protein SecF n=1 Tax=Nocardioides flavescens TaxID=2691959 RepID=A0A6L7EVD8_9ACTN|nr:protein translocase subunit SecF [Nocardioides flavescens]MXG90680.1 protein translocase subunit SecF [Nocardioides flavescens]
MGKFSRLGNDLYGGRKSIDFVHQRALWYAVSTVLVALAIVVVVVKGLNFGVEFTGGTQYRVPLAAGQVTQANADKVREAVADAGIEGVENPVVTTAGDTLLVQVEEIPQATSDEVVKVIDATVSPTAEISQDEISASWGQQVGQRAAIGVAVFLVLVMLFIGFYFREWKMSLAALVALVHDIVITIGVYALSGFPVTPAAVTGLLAILGFSLYDTVVVFDKVKENTHQMRQNRQTYAQAANLAVNQTLVRSVNTGIVALIPIGAILFTSTALLGASSLKDLALSQFVGMAVGVYSSIFLAPRVLVHLKSGESEVVLAERRAKARARNAVDPYATVPVFTDDMAVSEDPERDGGGIAVLDEEDEYDEGYDDQPARRRTAPQSDALGRGRTAPTQSRPVGPSSSSGRQQPSRAPRSKRK